MAIAAFVHCKVLTVAILQENWLKVGFETYISSKINVGRSNITVQYVGLTSNTLPVPNVWAWRGA